MDMRAIMEAAKPKIVETEKPKTRIKGVRAGNKLEVGARFGKTINGVHGTATIVEITKVQKREGQWDTSTISLNGNVTRPPKRGLK